MERFVTLDRWLGLYETPDGQTITSIPTAHKALAEGAAMVWTDKMTGKETHLKRLALLHIKRTVPVGFVDGE